MKLKIFFHCPIITLFILANVQAQTLFNSSRFLNYRGSVTNESGYHRLNDTPLNIDNEFVPQIRYNNISVADVFLNNPLGVLDLQVNANYSDRDKPDYNAVIRELYFDQALGEYFHITVGRKILKWGTGYAFNPTGVVEPTRRAIDPSDRLNQYQGRQVISVDAFVGSSSLTLLYANEARYDDGIKWGKDEIATRLYALVKNIDISLIGYWCEDAKSKIGFNTAWTYGSHLELHSELIAQKGSQKRYHHILDSSSHQVYFDQYPYRAKYQNSREIFYKALLGVQYTFDSGLNLMAEYLYNREGLAKTEWNQWRKFTLFHQRQIIARPPNPRSIPNFYNALFTLNREGSMRHYGYYRVFQPRQKSSLELSAFLNLADGSGVVLPIWNYYLNPNITTWLRMNFFFGADDSEFGLLFSRQLFQLGIKFSF